MTVRGDADRRPGLALLTRVELRKMVDTRAGLWLLIATAGLTLLGVGLGAFLGHASDHTWHELMNIAVQPASVLLPIVGVLLVTSEWSQRTTLTTFALVPQRSRVVAAKVLASLLIAVAAFVIGLALSLLATAVADRPPSGGWTMPAGLLVQDLAYLAVSILMGTAFGAALLSSAPGIVLYFTLPIGWAILTHTVKALDHIGDWLDPSRTTSSMTEDLMSGKEVEQLLVSLLLWLALPLLIGTLRIRRAEIS